MAGKGTKKGKTQFKIGKNGLPVLDSDSDFLSAFEKKKSESSENGEKTVKKILPKNRHGVQVLDSSKVKKSASDLQEEDFQVLLDEYYMAEQTGPLKKSARKDPVPLKKRLKRYPGVEVELDLHGLSVINAQIKVKSFILTCKNQGFFTVRIIVGKGLHSEEGPVLPDVVEELVSSLKTQGMVIFYEWDKKKKSQSGSMIVYLKQFEQYE